MLAGFPHSDTSGSKATYRLPEAFRRLVTSFIAYTSQGIHRAPFRLQCGVLNTTYFFVIAISMSPLPSRERTAEVSLITFTYSVFNVPVSLRRPDPIRGVNALGIKNAPSGAAFGWPYGPRLSAPLR